MIPIVNDRYRYICLYSAKVACTSLRQLYLAVHQHQLDHDERARLDGYHNINEVHDFDPTRNYRDYYTFVITRNPYARVVSAFLDQYIYSRSTEVQTMVASAINQGLATGEPENFLEFLELLALIPDSERDSHFQTQAYFPYRSMLVTTKSPRYKWLKQLPPHAFGLRYTGDVGNFREHLARVFKTVFKGDKVLRRSALEKLQAISKRNSSFYGAADFDDAALLACDDLDDLVFAPKPQDFLRSQRVRELIEQIYRQDFDVFGYRLGDIPHKSVSPEIDALPEDFDWRMYLRLNPDLPADSIYNERGVVRHYLEFGRFEQHPRAYKIEAPDGFDWRRYLQLNSDLANRGIVSEAQAVEHYISYGIREYRPIN